MFEREREAGFCVLYFVLFVFCFCVCFALVDGWRVNISNSAPLICHHFTCQNLTKKAFLETNIFKSICKIQHKTSSFIEVGEEKLLYLKKHSTPQQDTFYIHMHETSKEMHSLCYPAITMCTAMVEQKINK